MPRADSESNEATLSRFDAVGTHAPNEFGFVKHIGLHASEATEFQAGEIVSVIHMAPPLKGQVRTNDTPDTMRGDVAGRIPLSRDEILDIECWIAEVADEFPSRYDPFEQYIVHPPVEVIRDELSKTIRKRRFSCAGFVLAAHQEVGIDLIDESTLPPVTRASVSSLYEGISLRPDRAERFGLAGEGPWNLLLPGYIFHALDRQEDEIRSAPYQVRPGDQRFPKA